MTANHGNFDWSTDPETALRMQMAQGLMQGRRPPAQSWGEGLANAGSQMLGAYMARQAMDDGRAREQGRNDTLARALQAGQGRAAETKSYGDGTAINWNEQKADPKLMASILAGNRDTAPMGLQMQLGEIEGDRKNKADMAALMLGHRLNMERDRAKPLDISDDKRWFVPGVPGAGGQSTQHPAAVSTPAANPDLRTAQTAPNPPPVERQGLAAALAGSESGGQGPGVVNRQGYSGKYQFGEAAASAAGFYEPDDNPNDNKWNGTFKGLDGVNSYQDFLRNPAAQDRAFDMHQTHLGAEIEGRGLDRYIGQTVGGVPVTRDGLIGMMHLGGPAGTQKFLETGGQYNPADGNGTRLSDYGTKFAGAQPPAAPPRVQVADASGAIPQGALAPQQGPERLTIGGRSGTVVGGPSGPKFRDLTADEVAQRGLPRGTVAQVGRDGQVHVLNKGTDGGGGPFGGTSLPAQDSNILVAGDPASQEYALAYMRATETKFVPIQDPSDPTRTVMTAITPKLPPNIRPPVYQGQAAPPPAAAATPTPTATDTAPNPLQAPATTQQFTSTPIPGTERGGAMSPGERKEINTQVGTIDKVSGALASLADDVAKNGMKTGGLGAAGGRQSSLFKDVLLQLKEAQNLGVLNGPDERILMEQLSDPTSLMAYVKGLGGPEYFSAQLKAVQEKLVREKALLNKRANPNAPDAEPPAAPPTIMRFDAEGNLIQ